MNSANITAPVGTIEWGKKKKKAEEKARKGSFRRAALKDAINNG